MPLVAPWNRNKRAEREKIGHEAPDSVLRCYERFATGDLHPVPHSPYPWS